MNDLADLGADGSEDGAEGSEGAPAGELSDSISEPPELHCYGCNISSKAEDLIEKREKAATSSKGKVATVKWGNSTKRSVKKKKEGEFESDESAGNGACCAGTM